MERACQFLTVFLHLNPIYFIHDGAVKNQIMIGERREEKRPWIDVYRRAVDAPRKNHRGACRKAHSQEGSA
jgi:hypothetical protein